MERPRPGRPGTGKRIQRRSARETALHLLKRRPRTRAELCGELERLGHEDSEIEQTLAALDSSGYLNDTELARDYITKRAARLHHGRERLLADLERRGVTRAEAERAWNEAVESGDLDPAEPLRAAIRRRVRERGSLDSKAYARVYNALLRAGFEAEETHRELEPYRAGDPFDTFHDDETNDDFA